MQRLVLAKTLLHAPKVMILDEPASGMDPLSRRNLRLALRRLTEAGSTVFISSHILSELEEMCDALLFIVDGRVVHHGSADELKTAHADPGVVVVVRVVVAQNQ